MSIQSQPLTSLFLLFLTKLTVVECGDPGTPTNGRQIVDKGYVYGGSVRFECDNSYTLMKGTPQTIYCQADKNWNGGIPRCLGKCYHC